MILTARGTQLKPYGDYSQFCNLNLKRQEPLLLGEQNNAINELEEAASSLARRGC